MDICHRLREARTAIGKTQEQVAIEAGMNVTQYNAYERGRSRPAAATLQRLAAALKTTPDALLQESESAIDNEVDALNQAQHVMGKIRALRTDLAAALGLGVDEVRIHVELF